MKNWTSRFVVLMVAGAVMCSALMVGCGSKSEDDSNAPAVTNSGAKPATADTGT